MKQTAVTPVILGLLSLGRALGLRHQERRRPLDALLLGGELRPDLPGAAAARGRGPDRGRGRLERRARAAASTAHRRRPPGARGVAARHDDSRSSCGTSRCCGSSSPTRSRASRRSGCSRAQARATRSTSRSCARSTRGPARTRRSSTSSCAGESPSTNGGRSGARSSWSGCRARRRGLTAPTFWGVLMTGLPGFLREGFLPLGAFYAGLKLDGLAAGIVAADARLGRSIYLYERTPGRDALLVRISLGFVVVQAIVGLAANSTTVYLAQPVLLAAAWGLAFWSRSRSAGRWRACSPTRGTRSRAGSRRARTSSASTRSSRSSGARTSSPAALRLPAPGGASRTSCSSCCVLLLEGSIESFFVVVFLTGTPVMLAAARVVDPPLDARPGGRRAACLTPSGRKATLAGEHTFVPANNLPRCPRC